jgi:hypothetical protein
MFTSLIDDEGFVTIAGNDRSTSGVAVDTTIRMPHNRTTLTCSVFFYISSAIVADCDKYIIPGSCIIPLELAPNTSFLL